MTAQTKSPAEPTWKKDAPGRYSFGSWTVERMATMRSRVSWLVSKDGQPYKRNGRIVAGDSLAQAKQIVEAQNA